jgi:hypothetical protein
MTGCMSLRQITVLSSVISGKAQAGDDSLKSFRLPASRPGVGCCFVALSILGSAHSQPQEAKTDSNALICVIAYEFDRQQNEISERATAAEAARDGTMAKFRVLRPQSSEKAQQDLDAQGKWMKAQLDAGILDVPDAVKSCDSIWGERVSSLPVQFTSNAPNGAPLSAPANDNKIECDKIESQALNFIQTWNADIDEYNENPTYDARAGLRQSYDALQRRMHDAAEYAELKRCPGLSNVIREAAAKWDHP